MRDTGKRDGVGHRQPKRTKGGLQTPLPWADGNSSQGANMVLKVHRVWLAKKWPPKIPCPRVLIPGTCECHHMGGGGHD